MALDTDSYGCCVTRATASFIISTNCEAMTLHVLGTSIINFSSSSWLLFMADRDWALLAFSCFDLHSFISLAMSFRAVNQLVIKEFIIVKPSTFYSSPNIKIKYWTLDWSTDLTQIKVFNYGDWRFESIFIDLWLTFATKWLLVWSLMSGILVINFDSIIGVEMVDWTTEIDVSSIQLISIWWILSKSSIE